MHYIEGVDWAWYLSYKAPGANWFAPSASTPHPSSSIPLRYHLLFPPIIFSLWLSSYLFSLLLSSYPFLLASCSLHIDWQGGFCPERSSQNLVLFLHTRLQIKINNHHSIKSLVQRWWWCWCCCWWWWWRRDGCLALTMHCWTRREAGNVCFTLSSDGLGRVQAFLVQIQIHIQIQMQMQIQIKIQIQT